MLAECVVKYHQISSLKQKNCGNLSLSLSLSLSVQKKGSVYIVTVAHSVFSFLQQIKFKGRIAQFFEYMNSSLESIITKNYFKDINIYASDNNRSIALTSKKTSIN